MKHRAFAFTASFVLVAAFLACSSESGSTPGGDTPPGSGGDGGGAGQDGATPNGESDGGGNGNDGGNGDGGGGDSGNDSSTPIPTTPEVQLIGRWDLSTPTKPKASWPGSRIVIRFDGTAANVTLSHTNGFNGGPTWVNVIVDGVAGTPVSVTGANQTVAAASGLAAGTHVVEIEKRTEPNIGVLTLESYDLPGGTLLAPPQRKARRIEFLSDSTIDGFGVEGDVDTTCMGGEPPEFNNVRKSLAHYVAASANAEAHYIAYSGKGAAVNDPPADTVTFPMLYPRTLAETAGAWDFTKWTPDVVVISLGGTDFNGGQTAPGTFQTAYDGLVTSIRTHHPNADIFMLVWSQIKNLGAPNNTRTGLTNALNAIKSLHPGDTKLHVYAIDEATYPTDETGCYYHANDAHAQEAATQFAPVVKAARGW